MTTAANTTLAKLTKTSTVIRDVAGWAWPRRQLIWKQLREALDQAGVEAPAPQAGMLAPRKGPRMPGQRAGLIRTGTCYIRPRSMPCQ